MKKSNFLILGSNSFSGSSFIDFLLSKKYRVVGVSRSSEINNVYLPYKWRSKSNDFKFFKIDINKNIEAILKLMKKYEPSYVINFAAQGMVAESWKSPEDWFKTNLLSQVKLHNQIRKFPFIKKYIHFTTPEVYGSTNGWVKENFNFNPSTPYAVSRAACDLHLKSFFDAYNFPVIFTRASNVYGPGQQLYRIIPRTLLYSKKNKKLKLHGGGKSVRSFIHINDVSRALLKIIKEGRIGNSYHISTNEIISIKGLVKKICNLMKINFNELVNIENDRLGKDQAYLLDSSKLRKNMQWKDEISLDQGLEDTLNWFNNNYEIIKKLNHEYKHKK